jgi:hypothetical protein
MDESANPPPQQRGASGDPSDGKEAPAENDQQVQTAEQSARRRRKRRWLLGCSGAALIFLCLLGTGIFFATKFFHRTGKFRDNLLGVRGELTIYFAPHETKSLRARRCGY